MKTAATRGRSDATPVSFSTIEARISASVLERSGRFGARLGQSWSSVSLIALRHALDERVAAVAAREVVGLGQQRALGRLGR